MLKSKEGFTTICEDNGSLKMIIRRDPTTKKNIVYKVLEADIDEISEIMVPFTLPIIKPL